MPRCVYVPLVRVLLRACSFVVSEVVQNEAKGNIFSCSQHIFPAVYLQVRKESIPLQTDKHV